MDITFETEEWGIFRVNEEGDDEVDGPKKLHSTPVKLFIVDLSLNINLKVLAGAIPRNPTPRIVIPFQNAMIFDWSLKAGAITTSSGQFRLPNNPSKAVIFTIREDANTQMANPFELLHNDCTDVELDLNGKKYNTSVMKTNDEGDDADLYYETFRALGPNVPLGKFFIPKRQFMFAGMFMVAMDCTRSGMINQIDVLDTENAK